MQMEGNKRDQVFTVTGVDDFDLDQIFDCGQCFRWDRNEDGSYSGIAYGIPARVKWHEDERNLEIYNSGEKEFNEIWKNYFDLNRDYGEIKRYLAEHDEVIGSAIAYGPGIRILNQDKWETLISFIISQNNNIPRIKKCINSLAENLGEEAGEYEGKKYFDLPSPEVLASASLDDLAPCRLGYRAKYLIETAKTVRDEGIESLHALGNDSVTAAEASEALRKYCGVGPKVANCISLFSMGKIDSFPIDVWVKKVMNRLYGIDEGNVRAMEALAEERFGRYGGIAQQYLFYYITHNREIREG